MFKSILSAVLALGLLGSGAAFAHEYKAGDLVIGHPWSRATAPGAKVGGGYFTITNTGSTPDRLVSVSTSFAASADMHQSIEENGVSKMRGLEGGVEIKPGEKVEFAPGGKHVMFMGLSAPLKQGERVKGELTFEKAGKVPVEFAVEAAGGTPKPADAMKGMDHGAMPGMDHGSMSHDDKAK